LPKININIKEENKPNKPSRQNDHDIAKKIPKQHIEESDDEDEEVYTPQTISKSFVATLLKKKVEEKLQEKERKPRPILNFS
jgi:hypothetical protein